MKKIHLMVIPAVGALFFSGCATTDQQLIALQNENAGLKQDLQSKAGQLQVLSAEKTRLSAELDYCTKRSGVLMKEKSARLDEAAVLRKGIREFTEAMQKTLQTYFQRTEIVDYIGSELIARANTDAQKNVLLADLSNPVTAGGTLIGGRAWLNGPTRISFCLLRLNPENGKYVIVSMTPVTTATQNGLQTWVFDLPMAARKGDLVGVYFPDSVTIPYDDVDTGQVIAIPGEAKAGDSIAIASGEERNRRSYSFGVVGYLEAPVTPASNGSETPASEGAK